MFDALDVWSWLQVCCTRHLCEESLMTARSGVWMNYIPTSGVEDVFIFIHSMIHGIRCNALYLVNTDYHNCTGYSPLRGWKQTHLYPLILPCLPCSLASLSDLSVLSMVAAYVRKVQAQVRPDQLVHWRTWLAVKNKKTAWGVLCICNPPPHLRQPIRQCRIARMRTSWHMSSLVGTVHAHEHVPMQPTPYLVWLPPYLSQFAMPSP